MNYKDLDDKESIMIDIPFDSSRPISIMTRLSTSLHISNKFLGETAIVEHIREALERRREDRNKERLNGRVVNPQSKAGDLVLAPSECEVDSCCFS